MIKENLLEEDLNAHIASRRKILKSAGNAFQELYHEEMRMRRMLFVELRLRMNKYLNVVTLLQNGRKVKRLHF